MDDSPPSAPATFRSRSSAPPRAGQAGPPPSVPPPSVPPPAAPYLPPPPFHGLSHGGDGTSTGPRQPVYHRLNHDVFFMAAGQVLPWPHGGPHGALPAWALQALHMPDTRPATRPATRPCAPPRPPPPSLIPAAISPMEICWTHIAHPLNGLARREVAQGCVDYGWC